MSKKSWPPLGAIVNSTRLAGGIAAAPLHSTWPMPQSAVAQENFPFGSVEQRVRAQNLPDHGGAVVTVVVDPGSNWKPVVVSWLPVPVKAPGQIGKGQLL